MKRSILSQTLDELLIVSYGLKLVGLGPSEISDLAGKIRETKFTSKLIASVWKSNRYPYTVMFLAARVGMYIPPIHRVGFKAFEFFIHNIRYYEATFYRHGRPFPSTEEIFLSNDQINLLMKFRDDEILQNGVKWSPKYNDRKEMLHKFIEDNINVRGVFHLDPNSRSSYSPVARIILYTQGDKRLAFNIEELGRAIDPQKKIVWKSENTHFDPLSLLQLRSLILKKFGQWKDRVGYVDGPNELMALVYKLDSGDCLPKNRWDISAYLASPKLHLSLGSSQSEQSSQSEAPKLDRP